MRPAFSFTAYLASLPFEFLHWWFIESTFNLLKIMRYFLQVFNNLFSVQLLLKTFFKPWKNEYREGLVRFSLFMGMFIKSMLLLIYVFALGVVVLVEGAVFLVWVLLPLIIIWGLYASVFA